MKMQSYYTTNLLLRIETIHSNSLKGDNKVTTVYPRNINLRDFCYYLAAPTLVYWYEYPRNESIRWGFLMNKAIWTILSLVALLIIISEMIMPIIDMGHMIYAWQAVLLLTVPLFLVFLVTFFMVFECLANCYAELTRFADREFYQDWWNCTRYDDYLRQWNIPVHQFLMNHVYLEYRIRWRLSREWGAFITILYSAVVHQIFGCLMFKKFDLVYFFILLLQFPVAARAEKFNKNRSFEILNFNFWLLGNLGTAMTLASFLRDNFASQISFDFWTERLVLFDFWTEGFVSLDFWTERLVSLSFNLNDFV